MKKLLAPFLIVLSILLGLPAQAQLGPSSNGPMYGPNWPTGYVPSAREWQLQWTNKVNYFPAGIPILYGGTGATTVAGAVANLGLVSSTLPSTNIFVGNASNVATARALSQDCTLSNVGAITCLKTNNVAFAYFATGTDAANLTGTVASARLTGAYTGITGLGTIAGLTVTGSFTATGLVTLPALATQATNTIVGNATSGTASPTALAIGSCSAATSALTWTTNTGFGCNTLSSTYLPLAGGTMTGGILFSTTNTLDIGTSATVLAPRTVYAGTSVVTPVVTATTSATIGGGSAITSSGPGGALVSTAYTAIGTSGATVPLLSTANTWSAAQTHSAAVNFSVTNTYDIGTSATVLAPRTVYAGTSFVGPVLTATTSATIGGGSAITSSGPGGALVSTAYTAIGTSGATVPLLSTANTWTLGQTFSAASSVAGLTVTSAFTATGLVTLPALATQATNTVIGNATSGSASPTALSMTSCSTAASAVNWTTNTGFGCNTSITAAATPVSGITGAGTGVITFLTTPTSSNLAAAITDETGTGALVFATNAVMTTPAITSGSNITPQGRLTLVSATPVPVTSTSGAATIYYALYSGNLVPIYNGTNMVVTPFAELSNVTTNSAVGSAGPAAVTTNSNYDLFVWSNSGTVTLTRGPLWTSDTARGTGAGTTQISMINGVWTNTVAITNGPAANRGTYVGTVRSNGTSTIDVIFGAIAANGTAGVLGVWNAYNRVEVMGMIGDSTDSWAYATSSWRSANASNTMRVSVVVGLQEDFFNARFDSFYSNSGGGGNNGYVGVGYDSTTAISGTAIPQTSLAAGAFTAARGSTQQQPLGFHYFQALEYGAANDTFYGDNGNPTFQQAGLSYIGRY